MYLIVQDNLFKPVSPFVPLHDKFPAAPVAECLLQPRQPCRSNLLWKNSLDDLFSRLLKPNLKSALFKADLLTLHGQKSFVENTTVHLPALEHAGPPCGTSSRADERPIPEALLVQEALAPRPLRSDYWLKCSELARVTSANKIYDFILRQIFKQHQHGQNLSIKNPGTSTFWLLIQANILKLMPDLVTSNLPQYPHDERRPAKRTADEASYPVQTCDKYASLCVLDKALPTLQGTVVLAQKFSLH